MLNKSIDHLAGILNTFGDILSGGNSICKIWAKWIETPLWFSIM
jgi:hypothetical protein